MEKTMTSPNSWEISLGLLLDQVRNNSEEQPRIAIIGIGNELHADDAAGMLVAQNLLRNNHDFLRKGSMSVILAGAAPENVTGELRRFQPQLILLIDAAEMNQLPGTIQWIAQEDISGISASTHSLPLSILAHYLIMEFNCQVVLLGIQPTSNDFGGPVSLETRRAVDEIAARIAERFSKMDPSYLKKREANDQFIL